MTDFPGLLMSLLEDEEVQKCMHWLPSGRAFEISNRDLFISTVLRIHLNSTQFESFLVRLGKWGFRRLGEKVNNRYLTYTFGSPLFCREKPHLCNYMTLVKKIKKPKDKKLLNHIFDATKEPRAIPSVGLKGALVPNETEITSLGYQSCQSPPYQAEQYVSFVLQQHFLRPTYPFSPPQNPYGITFNFNCHQEPDTDQEATAAGALLKLATSSLTVEPLYREKLARMYSITRR